MLNDMLTYIRSSRCCALECFPVQKGAVLSSVRSKIRIPVRKCRKRESEKKLAVSYISPCMFGCLSLHNTTAGYHGPSKWKVLQHSGNSPLVPQDPVGFTGLLCGTGAVLRDSYGRALWDSELTPSCGVPVSLLCGTLCGTVVFDHRLILRREGGAIWGR